MREILFRAKKKEITKENEMYLDNGWVYGETLMTTDDSVYLMPNGISAECYLERTYNFRANSDCFKVMFAEIDPKTLCEFTGLCDKNGTRIFENDIIKDIENGIYKVVYDKPTMSFCFEQDNINWHPHNFNEPIGDILEKFEIIGNKFDNSNLLEELKC